MASVSGSVLGNLSGRLGNLSARTVNGRTILAARPSSFNVSQEPSVVEVRKKFGITMNFAKAVNSIAALSAVWEKVKDSGRSVMNTIFRDNFQYVSAERPTENNIITPDGFNLPVQSASVDADTITAQITTLNNEAVISPAEVDLAVSAVVCFYDPKSADDDPFKIIALDKDEAGFNFGQTYNLSLALNALQTNIASKYNNSILYLAVATKDAAGKVVQYSSTFTKLN